MEAQVAKVVKGTKKISNYTSLRVKKETRRKVLSDLAKINKKEYGRRILADTYIAVAISKMTADDLKQIQDGLLSNRDRFEMEYREYVAKNGFMDKDEYFGKRMGVKNTDHPQSRCGKG